jgi:simple sugar transport system ATP-binding protein
MILKSFREAPFLRKGLLQNNAITDNWNKARDNFNIKAESGDSNARSLSGGNQQKLILARELSGEPHVVIASQPTRGMDVSASEYVREQLIAARNRGAAVLLISADLEEILQLSDRIAVLFSGKIMGIVPQGTGGQEIGALMMGREAA